MTPPPLSKKQKAVLGALATRAYRHQDQLDLMGLPPAVQKDPPTRRLAYWRHTQTATVTGRTSFLDLDQRHYLPLKRHFEQLAGHHTAAYTTALRETTEKPAHRAPACEWIRQIHTAAAQAGLHPAYLTAISKARFKTSQLEDLTPAQLKQLLYTIRNRAAAKLGKGSPENRNKKQKAESIEQRAESIE